METNRLNDNFAFEFPLLALEAHAPGNFFLQPWIEFSKNFDTKQEHKGQISTVKR